MKQFRDALINRIKKNIKLHGYHAHIIVGGPSPRFIYTIGLSGALGTEFVFAGGAFFARDEALYIVKEIVRRIQEKTATVNSPIDLAELGMFFVHEADASWSRALLIGAYDILKVSRLRVLQITPNKFVSIAMVRRKF